MLEEVADPTYSGIVQTLGGGRSDKLTLSPLFSLLQLGQTAELSGDLPIIGPALMGKIASSACTADITKFAEPGPARLQPKLEQTN